MSIVRLAGMVDGQHRRLAFVVAVLARLHSSKRKQVGPRGLQTPTIRSPVIRACGANDQQLSVYTVDAKKASALRAAATVRAALTPSFESDP